MARGLRSTRRSTASSTYGSVTNPAPGPPRPCYPGGVYRHPLRSHGPQLRLGNRVEIGCEHTESGDCSPSVIGPASLLRLKAGWGGGGTWRRGKGTGDENVSPPHLPPPRRFLIFGLAAESDPLQQA